MTVINMLLLILWKPKFKDPVTEHTFSKLVRGQLTLFYLESVELLWSPYITKGKEETSRSRNTPWEQLPFKVVQNLSHAWRGKPDDVQSAPAICTDVIPRGTAHLRAARHAAITKTVGTACITLTTTSQPRGRHTRERCLNAYSPCQELILARQ